MAPEGSRGTVGIVRPTQRTGGFEDLLRILPQGIRLIPLALDVQRGALDEFQAAIPAYEAKVAELAKMGVDVINPSGAPPFMVLGYAKEQALIRRWEDQYNTRVFTSGTSNIDAMRALKVTRIRRRDLFPRRHQQDLRPVFRRCRLRMPRHGRHRRRFRQGAGAAEQHGATTSSSMRSAATRRPRRSTCSGRPGRRSTSSRQLERDLGVPVFHAVPVQCWDIQRHLGIREPVRGFGRLIAEMPAWCGF